MEIGSQLIIRTDASSNIGLGHFMRCFALAQAWRDSSGQVTFAMAATVLATEACLRSEGIEIRKVTAKPGTDGDADQTAKFAKDSGAAWIVVDGYGFDENYQNRLKGESGLKLLVIDDYGHADKYFADVILDQNLGTEEDLYRDRPAGSRLLLGNNYALIRREFLKWRNWKRKIPKVARKILITLGGADPDNVTEKVIYALDHIDQVNLEVRVIVGGANSHLQKVQWAAEQSSHQVKLEQNATNIPELMVWADMAISAGGSTCWELAFMGLPSVIIILAKNQVKVAEGLSGKRVALNIGWFDSLELRYLAAEMESCCLDIGARILMNEKSSNLVDGLGAERVVQNIMKR